MNYEFLNETIVGFSQGNNIRYNKDGMSAMVLLKRNHCLQVLRMHPVQIQQASFVDAQENCLRVEVANLSKCGRLAGPEAGVGDRSMHGMIKLIVR